MKRNWGLRSSAGLLGLLLLTGCGSTDSVTVQESAQSQETQAEVSGAAETFSFALPTEAEESEIYVEPIEGLSEDFIRGVDISSVLAQEKSGVVYYNEAGEEQDIFKTLAQSGVNYVRVRVWNDPYDQDGNSYGGGNCDVATAAEIGRRAAQYGMQLYVDFHYSDFWADPSKQMCPKAWEGMNIEEKSEALYSFTAESLREILDAGAEVGMVQIGNEINNGMSGEKDWTKRLQLLAAGSKAVREIAQESGREIRVSVHFTNIEDKASILHIADKLQGADLDYDVFAVSYYPFWHGSQDNLVDVLRSLADGYGKEVMVAENSYMYTGEDGDGSSNSVGEELETEGYSISVRGQAKEIRDICAAVASVGEAGIGYFYWEPAWIPVHYYDETAEDAAQTLAANKASWEEDGSGWASSFAAEYDPKDAGKYYGGSSWDNQALFDFTGHPLASLQTFRYLYHGTISEEYVYEAKEVTVDIGMGEDISLTDESNLIRNAGFEESDYSMWTVHDDGKNITDYQEKSSDAHSGDMALHFWAEDAFSFTAEQTLEGLEPGVYVCGFFLQGGDVGEDAEMFFYTDTAQGHQETETGVDGWCNWQAPQLEEVEVGEDGVLTVGVSVSSGPGGWGTLDDFYVYKIR